MLICNDSTSGTITVTASNGAAGTGDLLAANNLSDVANAATSNYNIAGIKSVSQALTSAQIKTINSVPISLAATFPAVAGKYWRVIEADIDYIDGAAAFTNNLQVGATTTVEEQFTVDLAAIFGSNVFGAMTDRRVTAQSVYAVNDSLHIHGSSDSATGDGSATLYITAQLVTK